MLDDVNAIEDNPNPMQMDIQGASIFNVGDSMPTLGEGATVRNLELTANEQQARVRQHAQAELAALRSEHERLRRLCASRNPELLSEFERRGRP